MPDPITTLFAFEVRDLNRLGLSVAAIARSLGAEHDMVREAHRMLYLAVNDSDTPVTMPTDAQREAAIERMPKRMQDRIRKARS